MAEPKTVVGFYTSRTTAERAAAELVAQGIPREAISVLTAGLRDDAPAIGPVHEIGADTEAGRDAVYGAIAGFVAGTILAVIPGIGPILAVGPITAAITGIGVGAAAGGILGMLRDEGVSEDEAEYYAEGIRRGGSLVSVRGQSENEAKVSKILEQSGAEDVKKLAAEWRATGWQGFDVNAPAYQRTRKAG
jgi:hypothetical protein